MGTDKFLFTPVPEPRNSARVLLLEVVPGHGAQIFARAPTESSVQTSAHDREPGMGTKAKRGLRLLRSSCHRLAQC